MVDCVLAKTEGLSFNSLNMRLDHSVNIQYSYIQEKKASKTFCKYPNQ